MNQHHGASVRQEEEVRAFSFKPWKVKKARASTPPLTLMVDACYSCGPAPSPNSTPIMIYPWTHTVLGCLLFCLLLLLSKTWNRLNRLWFCCWMGVAIIWTLWSSMIENSWWCWRTRPRVIRSCHHGSLNHTENQMIFSLFLYKRLVVPLVSFYIL